METIKKILILCPIVLILFGCGGKTEPVVAPGVILPTSCGQGKVLNRLGDCVTYTIAGNTVFYLDTTGRRIYFDQASDGEYYVDAQGNKTYLK
jgi:hypothetical protein